MLFTSVSLDDVCFSEDGGTTWKVVGFNKQRYDEYQNVIESKDLSTKRATDEKLTGVPERTGTLFGV